jgi:hypothetical protein
MKQAPLHLPSKPHSITFLDFQLTPDEVCTQMELILDQFSLTTEAQDKELSEKIELVARAITRYARAIDSTGIDLATAQNVDRYVQ